MINATSNETIRIIYPPDNSALMGNLIEIIGLAPAGINQVKFAGNGEMAEGTIADVKNGSFIKTVKLRKGKVRISVSSIENPEVSTSVNLFIVRKGEKTPKKYKVFNRHKGLTTVGKCKNCHKIKKDKTNYRKLKPVSTCGTKDCHDKSSKEFVHGPTAAGTCIYCHNPHGSPRKDITSRSGKDICLVCHFDSEEFFHKKYLHSALEGASCTGCHSPHQSDTKYFLRKETTADLCFECHDQESIIGGNVTHQPVKERECTLCHNPHSSENPNLLPAKGNEVCYSCHEDQEIEMDRTTQHKPAADNCLICHNVHTEDNPYMLYSSPKTLCIDCHKEATPDFISKLNSVTVPHKPVLEGECIACHTPHASAFNQLLKAPLDSICTTCHTDIGENINQNKYRHGPVEDKECTACHLSHGSTNPKILRTYFPAEFYVPYKKENYALCFECHNSDIALEAETTTLTDFRNGKINLHYLHVNKIKKGRSCKACHEIHAGPQLKHIRDEVPFGDMWSYPIIYSKTPNGGGCTVGCHKPLSYNRVKSVEYDKN